MNPHAHQPAKILGVQTSEVTGLRETRVQIQILTDMHMHRTHARSQMHIETEAPPSPSDITMHRLTHGNRASLLTNCPSFQDISKHQKYYYLVH